MNWKKKFVRNWGRLGMKFNTMKMEDALDALIDYRGKTPQKSKTGIMTLSAKSVKNNHIDYSQCYFISEEEYEKFMVRGFPKKGDILLTTEAPLGLVARLDRNDVAIAQRLLTLRGKENVLDNDYLLYYLQSPIGQASLKARETGTTVTGIKQAEFRKIEIEIPDYEVQKKVSGILRVIDQKIELNNAINNNLEQQAVAVFNKFYDTSTNQQPFTTLINVLGGGTPKTGNPEFWDGSIPFFTPKDVGTPYTFKTEKYITESGLKHCNSRLYPQNTTFVTARGTVGKISLAGSPMAMNQSCYALASDIVDPLLVYFYVLKAVTSLKCKASGAVFDAIVTRDFDDEMINILSDTDSESALSIIKPMMEAIHNNSKENMRLSAVRDALLPKLISGESMFPHWTFKPLNYCL